MNQAVNQNPNLLQTGLLLALVAAIAGTSAYGIYRYAGSVEENAIEIETLSDEQLRTSDDGKVTNPVTPSMSPNAVATAKATDATENKASVPVTPSPGVAPATAPVEKKNLVANNPKAPSVVLPDFAVPLDPSEFETECERFVEDLRTRQPDNPLALNVVAMYYSQMQQTTKADELWKRCVQLAPSDPIYYFNWATNYLNRSESELALQVMETAITNGLDRSIFTYQIAISLANLSRDAEVEELVSKEANKGSDNPSLLLLLGQSQVKLGKIAEARVSFEGARAGGVYNKALINGLLTCSVRLKDKESAEKYRKELESFAGEQQEFGQKQFDKRSEVEMRRFGLGIIGESIEVLRRAGDLDWAEAVGLRAIFLDPKNVDVYRLMADVYRDRREPQNAMVVYERLCSLQPTDVLNHLYHARASADAGHLAKAEGILKYAVALAPLDPACFATIGEFLLEQGRAKEAAWYLRQAVSLDPSREGRSLYIRSLRESGELEEAKSQEAILNNSTDVPRVRANP
jgi:tetratricopeptide (TPR) repeat protein